MEGLIVSANQQTARTGRAYVVLTLMHLDGVRETINVWGSTAADFKVGKYAVILNVKTNDMGNSCSKSEVSVQEAPPEYLALLPPIPDQYKWGKVREGLCDLMRTDGVAESLVKFFREQMDLMYPLYMKSVGGKSNHHSTDGGLAEHTYEILNMFLHIFPALPWHVDPFIVSYSSLMHDAAKIHCYAPVSHDYTEYMFLVNHVAGSADMAMAVMRKYNLPSRIMMHVQHCILAHHELLEYGSPVKPSTVEAEVLAMLDRISGHGTQIANNASDTGTKVSNLGTTVFTAPSTHEIN